MSIYKTIKECDKTKISKNEDFKMTLELWAEPDCLKGSCDSVLILDTSGSMIENGFEEMKKAACRYVDILTSQGKENKIAVVSFDNKAKIEMPLSDNACEIKRVINSLEAKNYTNHADAFKKAYEALEMSESSRKTAVLFTDGDSTIKGDTEAQRKKLLSLGTEIFTIALGTPLSIRLNVVKNWASVIKEEHFFHIEDRCQIEKAFCDIALSSGKSFTQDVHIFEKLCPGFVITGIIPPKKGKARKLDSRSLSWDIAEIGKEHREGAKLCFNVRYTGCRSGLIDVNETILYTDREGSEVSFPEPHIFIESEDGSYCENCGEPLEITAAPCNESVTIDGREEHLYSLGRIVNVNVTLKDICPGKRVALGVILTEEVCGKEETRGMKTLLIPAHHGDSCKDIEVKCIRFAVPEELTRGENGLCQRREFKVRTIINYVDAEVSCL